MKRLAVIGTGIAGMACAYRLHKKYDLTLYERNNYAGGHTNTVSVSEEGRDLPIDTGFMVYNEVTYPLLTKLFHELGVETKPTSMSFSVQHQPTGLEFSGSGLSGLFAQRRNFFRPSYWRLLAEINRFNEESVTLLEDPAGASLSLGDYAQQRGFSQEFLNYYLIPMSSAVWSTPADDMLRFPAVTLIRFFKNHGFLGLHTQHPWRTVVGGSRHYRDKIIAPYRDRIRMATPVSRVVKTSQGVEVRDVAGGKREFDHAIVACHADEALALLAQPSRDEKECLGSFPYQRNLATLHTDESVMPRTRSAWSSWNYRVTPQGASTVYWMNSLQGVSEKKNYFVSINGQAEIGSKAILKTIEYHHPVFSLAAIRAQAQLPRLNEKGPVYFCGSYFRYGFHEDALLSAENLAAQLA